MKYQIDTDPRYSHIISVFHPEEVVEEDRSADITATKNGVRVGDTEIYLDSVEKLNLFLQTIREAFTHHEQLKEKWYAVKKGEVKESYFGKHI